MAKYTKKNQNKVSDETAEEAMKIAKATQKPGQAKQQTKLIAQGIQKGIEQYKKQHKLKSRALDKKLRQAKSTSTSSPSVKIEKNDEKISLKLPWVLLGVSWIGFLSLVLLVEWQ